MHTTCYKIEGYRKDVIVNHNGGYDGPVHIKWYDDVDGGSHQIKIPGELLLALGKQYAIDYIRQKVEEIEFPQVTEERKVKEGPMPKVTIDRSELISLRDRALDQVGKSAGPFWKKAYQDLAFAADYLAAKKAQTELPVTDAEESVTEG